MQMCPRRRLTRQSPPTCAPFGHDCRSVKRIWPGELGWSRPVVGDLENGRRRVTVADVIALCRALDVDLLELLRGRG